MMSQDQELTLKAICTRVIILGAGHAHFMISYLEFRGQTTLGVVGQFLSGNQLISFEEHYSLETLL